MEARAQAYYYPQDQQPTHRPDLRIVTTETEEENGEPISKTWQPLVEAEFLQNNPQLSSAQADVYINRSVVNFLNEHSFRVPFNYFVGKLKTDGSLEVQGADMSTSWRRTRMRYGPGSNEDYEVKGYEIAHERLKQGASGVGIFSPQKFDENGQGIDRRYTFLLIKGNLYGASEDYVDLDDSDGEWITQINLMHQGDDLPFDVARKQYAQLEQLMGQQVLYGLSLQSNKDMLTSPLTLTDTSPAALDMMLGKLGIGPEEISRSLELQGLVKKDSLLSDDIVEYKKKVRELASYDLRNLGDDGTKVLVDTESLRNGIYRRANKLYARWKAKKEGRSGGQVLHEELTFMTQEQRTAFYRTQKEPEVYGGLSCPRPSDSNSIWDNLQSGTSMSETAGGEHFVFCKECPMPGCDAKNFNAPVKNGKIHCPKCKASAPYAC